MTKHAVSLALACALLAGCNQGAFQNHGSTVIANGALVVRGDAVILHGVGGTEARLDAAGNFTVSGRTIEVDPLQRQWLQQYYQDARAVRAHGIATGKAGIRVAVASLEAAFVHATGGHGQQSDARRDTASAQVDQAASRICLDLRGVKAAQEKLATSLPAFAPFARILGGDASDCDRS